jgi:aryl-alcohol dehydrogenase-like predicted oxidoreductase
MTHPTSCPGSNPAPSDSALAAERAGRRSQEYRQLGRTGVQVSCLCLGTLTLGAWGTRDATDAVRIIHAAPDAGDQHDLHRPTSTRSVSRRGLSARRCQAAGATTSILATKVTFPMGDDPNRQGTSRRWIMRAVEDSLRRPGTDWIDLYQIHRFDPATDLDATLGALTDLVRAGKIGYLGSSAFPPETIVEAQWSPSARRASASSASSPRTRSSSGASKLTCWALTTRSLTASTRSSPRERTSIPRTRGGAIRRSNRGARRRP